MVAALPLRPSSSSSSSSSSGSHPTTTLASSSLSSTAATAAATRIAPTSSSTIPVTANANASTSSSAAIIDWPEALQQCGDDEEFLREVLSDMRSETETQLALIHPILQSMTLILSSRDATAATTHAAQHCHHHAAQYQRIMRAAHVIKGAAANLMCHQLRLTALALEQAASHASSLWAATSTMESPQHHHQEPQHSLLRLQQMQQQQQHQQAAALEELHAQVQLCFQGLQAAAHNYVAFLTSIGI